MLHFPIDCLCTMSHLSFPVASELVPALGQVREETSGSRRDTYPRIFIWGCIFFLMCLFRGLTGFCSETSVFSPLLPYLI